jgi:nucleotide-binding universal stress UspA family protein
MAPLDGSGFGEQALPIAIGLAERMHADIEVVHVFDPLPAPFVLAKGAPVPDPTLDDQLRRDRANYISRMVQWLREQDHYKVSSGLLEGPVGRSLVDHITERSPDVVVMTTHGRSGLTRLWLGSVAQHVAQNSSAPLILVKPDQDGSRLKQARAFQRLLIPLDGSIDGEEAIDHAIAISGSGDVEFTLAHVMVPLFFASAEAGVSYPEVEVQKAAVTYLEEAASRVRARGLRVETRLLRNTSAATAILECAEDIDADLIALETHRYGKLTRILAGSVADKVIRGARVPVLVHSVATEEATGVGAEKSSRAGAGGGSRDS